MAVLTPGQIAVHAKNAGFTGDGLVWAIAVALAESGGNPTAIGVNSDKWKSRDRGLWQINNHWHPEVTDAVAFNPAAAAKEAYRISGGGKNWKPWATYTNGRAAAKLGAARMAAAGTASGTVDPSKASGTADPSAPTGPLDAVTQAIAQLGGLSKSVAAFGSIAINTAEWVANPRNWVRVLEVGGGAVLVVLAVMAMSRSGAGPVADAAAVPGKAAGAIKETAVKAIGVTKGGRKVA